MYFLCMNKKLNKHHQFDIAFSKQYVRLQRLNSCSRFFINDAEARISIIFGNPPSGYHQCNQQ